MKTGKSNWSSPKTDYQTFVPQEYCDYCFKYTITLHCEIGNPANPSQMVVEEGHDRSDVHQYQYCGTNVLTVTLTDGVPSYEGYENMAHDGDARPVDVRYVRDVTPDILSLDVGGTITSAVWQSYWGNYNYNHHGPGEVNAKDMTWPGHPNHS